MVARMPGYPSKTRRPWLRTCTELRDPNEDSRPCYTAASRQSSLFAVVRAQCVDHRIVTSAAGAAARCSPTPTAIRTSHGQAAVCRTSAPASAHSFTVGAPTQDNLAANNRAGGPRACRGHLPDLGGSESSCRHQAGRLFGRRKDSEVST